MGIRFVGLPDVGSDHEKRFLYKADRKTPVRHVLWGDFLDVESEEAGGWLKVIWARHDPAKRQELFIEKVHTIEQRPLEIVFLDVGQGDGAVLITPEQDDDERVVVVDAGPGTNMHEFLTGRFTSYREGQFDAAVITHPDEDHYYGFKPIFEDPDLGFKTVYHSGLVERPVSGDFAKVGGKSKKDAKGLEWLTDLASTDEDIEQLFGNPDLQDTEFKYPQVMHAAAINPKVEHYRMLSTKDGKSEDGRTYMPDFAPSDDRGYTIEVLGPFVERCNGKKALRRIKSYGETKNGHSVLLRLQYGSFSVFFGGDLNAPAEEFLIKAYGGQAKAKERFGADVMKVCHHGSEKVTDAFISAVHPTCFVISSGDEEGHVHPRPDLLGRLGRLGRGSAPVLLSTELQRSTREKEDAKVVDRLLKGLDQIAAKPKDTKLRAKLAEDVKTLGRTNVSVDGTIYVKTDGERLIAAFKIEEGAELEKWFYFEYAFKDGELVLV